MDTSTMSIEEVIQQFSQTPNQQNAPEVVVTKPGENPLDLGSTKPVDTRSVEEILADKDKEGEEGDKTPKGDETVVDTDKEKSGGRPKEKLDATDLNSLSILIDSGKIQPWVNDNNEVIMPTTRQELIELMDDNFNTFNDNNLKEVNNQFYQTKSPVWQTLLKYAETAKSLDEVAPLFSAMQESEITEKLDIEDVSHQEYIIKKLGFIQGLDEATIDADILDLKERGKLKERAEKVKPGLDKYNAAQIQQELARKNQEAAYKQQEIQNHINSVIENVISKKDISGVKIKEDHKRFIASTLVPDDSLGGLPIYTIIDNLLAQGKFDVLSRIALLATNEELHDNYYGAKKANQVAASLQRTLRDANATKTGSIINDNNETTTKKIDLNERSRQYL